MKNVKSTSHVATLKKLGTRAAILLLAWLMLRPGKKKQIALMIKEATLGGHRIKYEKKMSRTRNEDGEFDVAEEGHTVYITPTAWVERRRNLIAQSAVTEMVDKYLFADKKTKRGRGPRTFQIAGMTVLAITSESPTIRTFRVASPVDVNQDEYITLDCESDKGKTFVAQWKKEEWDVKAWTKVPCMLTDAEAAELKMLDLVYRVCVDLGLQQESHMAWSDAKTQTLAAIEQERTKGGLAEFSGRPDDGMEGYEGGGIAWASTMVAYRPGVPITDPKDGEVLAVSLIPVDEFGHDLEAPAWSMDDGAIVLNGFPVPQRPTKAEFMLDQAWGWNCRLDLAKQMVVYTNENGEEVWLETRSPEFKAMDKGITNWWKRIPVLKADPVRIEVGRDRSCKVMAVKGHAKRIEPIGLIRRHLHGLIQSGHATYIIKPYVCKVCNGMGMAPSYDRETGAVEVDHNSKIVLYPCGKCRGSGAGAPGYHMDYNTGLCTPNQLTKVVEHEEMHPDGTGMVRWEERVANTVIKPESFACKGKKVSGKWVPCGNLEFFTDVHAEVCTKCGAELWKNSILMLFDAAHTSEAYDLPDAATHSSVQLYGQLVKDLIRSRVNRVMRFQVAGKTFPQSIGTNVSIGEYGLRPNTADSMADIGEPLIQKIRGSLPYVISMLRQKPKIKGWAEMALEAENDPIVERNPKKGKFFRMRKFEKTITNDVNDVVHQIDSKMWHQRIKHRWTVEQYYKLLDATYGNWNKKESKAIELARKEMGQ